MNRIRLTTLALLAAAALMPCGALAQKAGEQNAQNLEKTITRVVKANYLLYLPKEYGKDTAKKWPLILFLHGSGESGDDIEKVKVHGPPKLIAAGKEFPFIVVSPQAPASRVGWQVETLNTLLDDVIQKYHVDEDRVYLTGLSMGGFGTWSLASANPERFAAIAPICGGGDPFRVRRLRSMPIWVFHGAKDPTVPVKMSEDMVEALKKAGGDVKFTVYPDAGHDSWTATYDNPELYTWFLEHTRKKAEAAK
jgi:predicted peptidase